MSEVDLRHVPQITEGPEQRAARMGWFRDAKFGMFIHWGPCTVGDREIGWGRNASRPWDINEHRLREDDLEYDNYYKQFDPVKFDPDAWVTLAKQAGMKYMVLTTKHHDGFALFDTKLSDYSIMNSPYGQDIVKQFVDACHRHDMKVGLYYSTRDWYHPDYLVGDNKKYDAWYRGQVEELLSNYGQIDIMWFDHVGGGDWSKWEFDSLFAMMYRLQPHLIVNNRAAAFCGCLEARSAADQGPASPEIAKMTAGDFYTPEGHIGKMDLEKDWESCIILSPAPDGGGWSYRSNGQTRPLNEAIRMLVSTATGGGNLLLNLAPDAMGEFRPSEIAIAQGMGTWLADYGEAVYGTRGGPLANGDWGGSTHDGRSVYLLLFDDQETSRTLKGLSARVLGAQLLPTMDDVEFAQKDDGLELQLDPEQPSSPATVVKLTLDQPIY